MINLSNSDVWLAYSVLGVELLLVGFLFIAWLFSSRTLQALYDKYPNGLPIASIFMGVYMSSKIIMYIILSLLHKDQVDILMYVLMGVDAGIFGLASVVAAIVFIPDLRKYIAHKRGI